ncbi:cytochrome c oxidase subunit 8C, mitochondrial [Ursus americanus]|uniref:cytochrome c oxidase subunit 8C, mitochondrial n=1 Tax=Ursus americanus TaxID=9643 RepID=UPI001E67B5AC|nr:cytochrome c oxidase subunit 8C, mitochondrial [Ursus americanus]
MSRAPAQTSRLEARAIVLRLTSLRLVLGVLSASPHFTSADAMPRLLVLCLLPRRRVTPLGLQLGRRLARLELRRRQRPKSSADSVVGLVVLFATFLVPCGYVLSNLREFRRE